MTRPTESEYASFYKNYIALAKGDNIKEVILNYSEELTKFYNEIPNDKADYAYQENKWTVKDLLQHLIDAERVFVYRATRFARKDLSDLLGFDENDYAANADIKHKSLENLKKELIALRTSTNFFLENLNENQLQEKGSANNSSITVNAIAFIIFGHLIHHKNILIERYL